MEEYSTANFIKDVWFYIKPQKFKFFFGTFLRFMGDVSDLYASYGIASLVGFLTVYKVGDSLLTVYTIFTLLILTTITQHLGQHYGTMTCYAMAAKIDLDARIRTLKHLFYIDMNWHEKENSGNKVKRIDRGGTSIENVIRMWVSNMISTVVNFVGVIVILASTDMFFGVMMAMFVICFYILSRVYKKRAYEARRAESLQDEVVSGLMFESVNNIRTVKVMNMRDKIVLRVKAANDVLLGRIMDRLFWFQTGSRLLNLFSALFKFIAIGIIIYGIVNGYYNVSFLVLFSAYFNKIKKTVEEFSNFTDNMIIAKSDIWRIRGILNEKVIIDDESNKVTLPTTWEELKIDNLSFAYGDKDVLHNLSFTIERGKKVGIVGLSGAGKSTLFKLLLKENESYNGDIAFDNLSLKDISKNDYQKHTAVVLQDTELFNISLKENIIIEDISSVNESILDEAVETAHVKDFMNKLPEGMDTVVGEKGVKLSGGEKQRVGIARAVYKKPELLLMDEATSHLDIESEKNIQESLHKFFKEVTAIVIAHRLTTLKEMDTILVLENGTITESGSFNELYKKKGRFFELWEKQKL